MKKLLLFTFLLVQTFAVFGYDYQTVYSHRIVYFDNINHDTEAIKMDSVRLQQNDSVIYPFRGLQLVSNDCFTPFGFTWLGEKIIVSQNWNYFFTELDDTIKLKTAAKLNETWNIFKNKTNTVTGTVTGWTLSNVLGMQDSVKTITLHVFDSLMMPVRHDLEGKTIVISKNYGFVSAVNFLYFPSPQYSNYSSIQISKIFNLVGMTNPTLGVQNFSWFEANDFQVGDEFHYVRDDYMMGYYNNSGITKKKILDRKSFLPDSIIYSEEITSLDTFRTYSTTGGWSQYTRFNSEISKNKIVTNKIFDELPGVYTLTGNSRCEKYNMYGDYKKLDVSSLFKKDDCWNNFIIDDACDGICVKKGFGAVSAGSGCWMNSYYYMDMVYYKKGNVEWGTPLRITNPNVSFAPKGTEWYYNEELYPIWYGLPHEYNYTLLRSVGDTVINNKTCNHIKSIQNHVGCEFLNESYCYQQNDTVYFYSAWNSQFYPVYIWNAKPGESWNINYSIDNSSNFRVIATLDSMKYINISGRMLRKQFITYKSEYYGVMRNVQVIEGLGDVDNLYSFDFSEFLACDDFGGNINGLRCYVHPEYGTYKTSDKECDFRTGLEKLNQINFTISPNPAKDVLKITLNESVYAPTTAKIINSLGKTVLVQKLENQEETVSLKNIPAGIYLLQIEKGNQKESVKFIKQ